jgi:hypothetical protein
MARRAVKYEVAYVRDDGLAIPQRTNLNAMRAEWWLGILRARFPGVEFKIQECRAGKEAMCRKS